MATCRCRLTSRHADGAQDQARYQTVYAQHPGAVAAPTAGLHFDEAMLAQLRGIGIELAWLTLHVGAGTFQPVRVSNLAEHKMHSERYDIPPATVAGHRARARGRTRRDRRRHHQPARARIGCARAREGTGFDLPAGAGETDLFITPGYGFRVVDRLLTNFHLPRSTLLMLVAAFAGMETMRAAYSHAIAQRYRFFSYGDAMLIDRIERAP